MGKKCLPDDAAAAFCFTLPASTASPFRGIHSLRVLVLLWGVRKKVLPDYGETHVFPLKKQHFWKFLACDAGKSFT